MAELQLQAARAAAFIAVAVVAVAVQRLAPHARRRGSWRVNGDRTFQTYTGSDPATKVETGLAELLGDVTLPRALLLPLQR